MGLNKLYRNTIYIVTNETKVYGEREKKKKKTTPKCLEKMYVNTLLCNLMVLLVAHNIVEDTHNLYLNMVS